MKNLQLARGFVLKLLTTAKNFKLSKEIVSHPGTCKTCLYVFCVLDQSQQLYPGNSLGLCAKVTKSKSKNSERFRFDKIST